MIFRRLMLFECPLFFALFRRHVLGQSETVENILNGDRRGMSLLEMENGLMIEPQSND